MLLIDALETKAKLSGGDGARFMKLFQGVVLSQV
jgi:hypothetical protein